MRKAIGILALLGTSAALLPSIAAARDRDDDDHYRQPYVYTQPYGYYGYNTGYGYPVMNEHQRHEAEERAERAQRRGYYNNPGYGYYNQGYYGRAYPYYTPAPAPPVFRRHRDRDDR